MGLLMPTTTRNDDWLARLDFESDAEFEPDFDISEYDEREDDRIEREIDDPNMSPDDWDSRHWDLYHARGSD